MDSPIPSYEEELLGSQRSALRVAALLGAALLLAFSALDRAVAPPEWMPLLVVRAAAAAVLLVCARLTQRHGIPTKALVVVAAGAISGAVEVALFATGGAASPYLYAMMLVQAGLGLLVPLRVLEAALVNAEILAIALGPLAVRELQESDRVPFGIAAAYLATMAVVSVAGSLIGDRVRRREHQARAEFARHMGLLNLGTLAGGLAHELSNPLNALGLQVEMLVRDPGTASRRAEKLRNNVDRMRNILEAMRNGARLTGGDRRQVDLAREVDLAYTLLENKLRTRATVVRSYAELPPVYCQPTLLGQVLVNLLANAADAVSGAEAPRIWLRLKREGANAVIEFEDNGPGVPEELRTKIFEPFFSTKGDKGNGLGLWISSEIARMHGGTLTAERGAQGGALFRLVFPLDARNFAEEPGVAATHA